MYSNNNHLAYTITTLRNKHNLTQKDLAILISERSSREMPLSTSAVSAWESGRKRPSMDVLQILCSIFEISMDDLLTPHLSLVKSEDSMKHINEKDLELYHGKPVFVSYHNKLHSDQWYIVDYQKKALIGLHGLIYLSEIRYASFYTEEPYYTVPYNKYGSKPLTISELLSLPQDNLVWIKMITSDVDIQKYYDGYYGHNELRTCLIKENGLTLPYQGLGISYYAYKDKC